MELLDLTTERMILNILRQMQGLNFKLTLEPKEDGYKYTLAYIDSEEILYQGFDIQKVSDKVFFR